MKKLILLNLLLLLIRINVSFGQDTINSKEIYVQEKSLILLNKSFSHLEKPEKILNLEKRFKIQINSVAACLIMLSVGQEKYFALDSTEVDALDQLLKQVADSLTKVGTPLLIGYQGGVSIKSYSEYNKQLNPYNLIYHNWGHSCTDSSRLLSNGISVFSQRTLQNLGLKEWPIELDISPYSVINKEAKQRPKWRIF